MSALHYRSNCEGQLQSYLCRQPQSHGHYLEIFKGNVFHLDDNKTA